MHNPQSGSLLPDIDAIAQIDQFVAIANDCLPGMLIPESGLFCFDRQPLPATRRGESIRYSLIVLLGLIRRSQAGLPVPVPIDELAAAIDHHSANLGLGDAALALWAQVRLDPETATGQLARLKRRVNQQRLDDLEGLEIAWWVIAAAEACAAGIPADDTLFRAISAFRRRRSDSSPLFRHVARGRRAAFPNFATEIYSLLALAQLARYGLLEEAEQWAVELADLLIKLRLDDGGWPWLYHASAGTVVEPYEIYSVHQDAMAPMAFLALAEVTGRLEYARAAIDGVAWCYGQNALSQSLVEPDRSFICRSIRRQGSARSLNLYGNTALSLLSGRGPRADVGRIELNPTCRPYHLGWILEAWSGRDELVASAVGSDR